MEDTTQSNRDQTAKMNASKAPQKVEVVVANPCLLYTSDAADE